MILFQEIRLTHTHTHTHTHTVWRRGGFTGSFPHDHTSMLICKQKHQSIPYDSVKRRPSEQSTKVFHYKTSPPYYIFL